MKKTLLIGLGLLILDRLTKRFVLDKSILSKNFKLYFWAINSTLFYIIAGVILLLFIFLLIKSWSNNNFLLNTGFFLIITGGLSNLFDRIFFGYVIDWIRVFFLPFSIFNIADLMIFSGLLCLIFHLLKSR